MELIGGGKYSHVYASANRIIKAMRAPALEEFNKQRSIHEHFTRLENHHPLLSLIKRYVRISRPLYYNNQLTVINDVSYQCTIEMERLRGLPQKMLPREYCGQHDEVMLHLSFNNPTKTALMMAGNVPRGLFFSSEDADEIIETLRLDHGLELTSNDLRRIVGFIYGWIYYCCRLAPHDIEITLGHDDRGFCVNVMDFGLTAVATGEENIRQSISDDEYIDVYADRFAKEGFRVAREIL